MIDFLFKSKFVTDDLSLPLYLESNIPRVQLINLVIYSNFQVRYYQLQQKSRLKITNTNAICCLSDEKILRRYSQELNEHYMNPK